MNNQEAVEVLKNNVPKTCKMVNGRLVGGFDDWESDMGHAIKAAISALEKQIAKQPKNIEKITFNGSMRMNFRNGECPCCGAYIDTDDDPNVCLECGQKLSW